MQIIMITRPIFKPTIKNLKNEFESRGFEFHYTFNPLRALRKYDRNAIFIRYGNFRFPKLFTKHCRISLNDRLLTTNKIIQALILNRAGIFVPERISEIYSLPSETEIIVRKKRHMQSKDAHLIKAYEISDYMDYDDFMRYYSIKKEYRVHVFQNLFYFVQVKRIREENYDKVFRCYKKGWSLDKTTRFPNEIIEIAQRAVKALDLDFGGVDIGILEKNNKPIVFEVNSACGVSENNASLYFKGLFEIIKEKLSWDEGKKQKEHAIFVWNNILDMMCIL